MQAILLTEIFQRFHGKKINVRCSRQFEELYSRVSNHSRHKKSAVVEH